MSLIIEHTDVIICGGGPAGSTCALTLANTGLNVLVLEKEHFPRNKVCGDAIAAYVPKVLNAIHPKYKAALENFTSKLAISTCRIVTPNRKQIDIVSKEDGYISTRHDFDNFLYELASVEKNITYCFGQKINKVLVNPEETIVTTDTHLFKAKIVIGCDGAQSIVAKELIASKPDREHYSGSVRAYYKNVSGLAEKTNELHFLKNFLPGYFWIFPLKNGVANVGLVLLSSEISKRKISLRESLEDIINNDPILKIRFENSQILGKIEGYGLPLGSRKVCISGARFMLCGDAASLIDPATGEGIGQAMISGRYAAEQVKRCFEQNKFSADFMKQYDKLLYGKLWKNLKRRYLIRKYFLSNSKVLNSISNLMSENYLLKRVFYKLLGV